MSHAFSGAAFGAGADLALALASAPFFGAMAMVFQSAGIVGPMGV